MVLAVSKNLSTRDVSDLARLRPLGVCAVPGDCATRDISARLPHEHDGCQYPGLTGTRTGRGVAVVTGVAERTGGRA
jgi:hypothetical protein